MDTGIVSHPLTDAKNRVHSTQLKKAGIVPSLSERVAFRKYATENLDEVTYGI